MDNKSNRKKQDDENGRDNDKKRDDDSASSNNMKTPATGGNPSKKSQGGEPGSSCSVSTAGTSTALTPMSVISEAEEEPAVPQQQEVDLRRQQLHGLLYLQAFLVASIFSSIIFVLFPFYVLVGFGALFVSAGALSYTAYRRLLLEYQEIVSGDGFARFLPESLNRQLLDTSIHDWLTDDSFVREYGFLALYFIPGLSQEQLATYLHRLAPHHQDLLQRRGLGYMIGDGFMRIIMGDNRWRPQSIETNNNNAVVAAIEHHPNAVAVRRLDFDSDMEDGDEIMSCDTNSQTLEVVNTGNPEQNSDEDDRKNDNNDANDGNDDNATTSDEERERQLDLEGELVLNAAFDGAWSYFYTVVDYMNRYAFETVIEPTSSVVARASMGTSVLALGFGFWGMYAGYYNRPNLRTPSLLSSPNSVLPSSRALWSTAAIGAASAGVMLYTRSAYRNWVKPQNPPSGQGSTKKSGSSKQK